MPRTRQGSAPDRPALRPGLRRPGLRAAAPRLDQPRELLRVPREADREQTLFRLHLGEPAVFLDVNKVKAAQRETWLDDHVIHPGRRLLITNPKAVQTGLNNLVHFSRAIWADGVDYDARVLRQANGRVHRIGQTRDVLIEVPYYKARVQKTALDLVARKVTASVQVDGLSIEGALESAGAGEDDSVRAAMSMGRALYEAWLRL